MVDEDVFTAKIYAVIFGHEDITLKIAKDGEEALEILKEKELPSLIFLDVIIPKKNGFEVLKEVKQDPRLKDIPVLILSNLCQKLDIERGFRLGAKEYLIKGDLGIEGMIKKAKQYLN